MTFTDELTHLAPEELIRRLAALSPPRATGAGID
jgi:hypothetical protein